MVLDARYLFMGFLGVRRPYRTPTGIQREIETQMHQQFGMMSSNEGVFHRW